MTTRKSVSQPTKGDTKKTKSSDPTYDEIKKKAHEIYLERASKGIHGNADHDWHKAVMELQKNKK
jgi:hypothetical protein